MPRTRRIHLGPIGGLLIGAGCVLAGQMLEGGTLRSVAHLAAATIVFGGSVGAALVSFPRGHVTQAAVALRGLILDPPDDTEATADTVVRFAWMARTQGVLALEDDAERQADPLVRKALRLVVDGVGVRHLREMVEIDIANQEDHDLAPAAVFEALGGYAPTFGILGAVLGLIHVMENLGDPAKLGAGIATAFVATVYGVGSANLVFLPIAARLRERAETRARRGEMILEGMLAIQEGLSPRLIEEKLHTYRKPTGNRPRRVARAA